VFAIVSEDPESSTMKMEEAVSSETLVNIYHNTWPGVPEDRNLKQIKYKLMSLAVSECHNIKRVHESSENVILRTTVTNKNDMKTLKAG
jgi:hypothetical protein